MFVDVPAIGARVIGDEWCLIEGIGVLDLRVGCKVNVVGVLEMLKDMTNGGGKGVTFIETILKDVHWFLWHLVDSTASRPGN